jgi:hypothetical protein
MVAVIAGLIIQFRHHRTAAYGPDPGLPAQSGRRILTANDCVRPGDYPVGLIYILLLLVLLGILTLGGLGLVQQLETWLT